jgi:hypothetical protein
MSIESTLEDINRGLTRVATALDALLIKLSAATPLHDWPTESKPDAALPDTGNPTSEDQSLQTVTTPTMALQHVETADSYAEAASAITKLSRSRGREAAVALLGNFGATRLPDVPKDQLTEVKNAVFALLESPS